MSSQSPQVHQLIPLFELPAVNRDTAVGCWDYKQRYNLVIVLIQNASCQACCDFLLSFVKQYYAYRDFDTEILAIANCQTPADVEQMRQFAEEHQVPFPILWDEPGRVRDVYLGGWQVGIFVCDRYGELYTQAIADEIKGLPDEPAIREWAEYVDMQCAECFPPSWR